MIDLPHKEIVVAKTKEVFKTELGFAHRLFDYWFRQPKGKYLHRSALDVLVLDVSQTLTVQAVRQYKTVIELCERGEAHDASVIARSLFETSLAMVFVLSPDVRLRVEPVKNKTDEWKVTVPRRGRRKSDLLSHRLRAALYAANGVFKNDRKFQKLNGMRGYKRVAKQFKADAQLLRNCEAEVGKEWAYILRKYDSYSGLSIFALAKRLGNRLDYYYETIYHLQSRMAHSSDAIRHTQRVAGTLKPMWFSSLDEVGGALWAGSACFLICLTMLDEGIDFGVSNHTAIHGFRADFKKFFATLEPEDDSSTKPSAS